MHQYKRDEMFYSSFSLKKTVTAWLEKPVACQHAVAKDPCSVGGSSAVSSEVRHSPCESELEFFNQQGSDSAGDKLDLYRDTTASTQRASLKGFSTKVVASKKEKYRKCKTFHT